MFQQLGGETRREVMQAEELEGSEEEPEMLKAAAAAEAQEASRGQAWHDGGRMV